MWGFSKDDRRANQQNQGKAKKTTKAVKNQQTNKTSKRHGGTGTGNKGKH